MEKTLSNKNVLLFCTGIDDVLGDTNRVGGIQVQMMFWGEAFALHGWKVYALSEGKTTANSQLFSFIHVPVSKLLSRFHLGSVQEIKRVWYSIHKSRPKVVMTRGASRGLFFIKLFCRLKRIKLVFMGASDTDFVPGKEIIKGSSINRILYQKALKQISYIVTQNNEQHKSLKDNYGKESIILANIWIPCVRCGLYNQKKYDVVWVAYLRPLKRAEWFLDLARQMPQYSFAIAGGVADQSYFDKIEKEAKNVQNLAFLGALSFNEINDLMACSKLLVCTSEFEGFPNTFLQAWAQSIPVISTVNPSDVVSKYRLGVVVSDQSCLWEQTTKLLEDDALYLEFQNSISAYFLVSHDADNAYYKLADYIHIQ